MEWLSELVCPGHTSIASTLVLYSFVIAAGIYLGKLKIFGVSLGVTFVLFVGIVMGEFGYVIDEHTLKFVREFGLILFIFSIGLQVGPGFFASFKQGGVIMNGLAVLSVGLSVLIAIGVYYFGNISDKSALVGVMSGAIISWITAINELSSSVILFTGATKTMSVAIYTEVIRASYGTAAALSTILTLTTITAMVIFFKVSGRRDVTL